MGRVHTLPSLPGCIGLCCLFQLLPYLVQDWKPKSTISNFSESQNITKAHYGQGSPACTPHMLLKALGCCIYFSVFDKLLLLFVSKASVCRQVQVWKSAGARGRQHQPPLPYLCLDVLSLATLAFYLFASLKEVRAAVHHSLPDP